MPEIDFSEDELLRKAPALLDLLLCDRTRSTANERHNILWATADYEALGEGFEYKSEITPRCITGQYGKVIMPRVLKDRDTQRRRSRENAEIFTPSWVCNRQNNAVDSEWLAPSSAFNTENADRTWTASRERIRFAEGKRWEDYVSDIRLEITCGEAPYLVSRYDTTTGRPIPLPDRIGLLDRKLRVVDENTKGFSDWNHWSRTAYKSVYGYEWQGDSLLLARESMLMTYVDYYEARFLSLPSTDLLTEIARIISWNIWQMDGLKGVVPDSCRAQSVADSLFDMPTEALPCPGCATDNIRLHNGDKCMIMDWTASENGEKIRFIDTLNQSTQQRRTL